MGSGVECGEEVVWPPQWDCVHPAGHRLAEICCLEWWQCLSLKAPPASRLPFATLFLHLQACHPLG